MTATLIGTVVPARDRRIFAFLLGALLTETVFFVVLSPLLPIYVRDLHLGRTGAGVMTACYSIGYGLAAVPAGALVGKLGPRLVAIGGLTLVAASCATFGLAQDVVALDAARIVTGVGAASVWAGSIPWLLSLGNPRDRGRLIGLAFSAASGGACAGPALGALATVTGPRPAFLGLSVLIGLLAVTGTAVSAGREPPPTSRSPRALRTAVRAPGARRALAMVALPSLGFGVAGVLMPLRLRGLGVAEAGIAGAYLVAALLETIANPLIGRWFDRRGGSRVVRATMLASAACLIALALPLPAALLLVALVLSLPVIGTGWVTSLTQLSSAVERTGTQSGAALGLFNIDWAACQMIGAIGGAQASRLGSAVPFLVLAALYAVAVGRAGPSAPD
jgi:predicted MFS family arabinose efflux permease